jgi:hypothetical protein
MLTPPVASANLLAAANSAESYTAKQKKNTTAMLKSKQTPPIVNTPTAASGSEGKDKEKDIPAYKFRSPIDDITAPQHILDCLLSLPVTLSAKDIVTLSMLVQKEL